MSHRDDLLREFTFKGDAPDVGRRVFYTLLRGVQQDAPPDATTRDPHVMATRNTKAIGLLVETLVKSGKLSAQEVDTFLLQAIGLE